MTTPPAGVRGLLDGLSREDRARLAGGSVEDWSRESWAQSRDYAYTTLIGDPCGPMPKERPTLTEEDVQKLIPAVRRQVTAGGLRLARMLDDALLHGRAPERRRAGD